MQKEKSKIEFKQLFIDTAQGTLSVNKLGFMVGLIVLTAVFIGDFVLNKGTTSDKMAAYGGTNGITAMFSKFISKSRGRAKGNDRDSDDC